MHHHDAPESAQEGIENFNLGGNSFLLFFRQQNI